MNRRYRYIFFSRKEPPIFFVESVFGHEHIGSNDGIRPFFWFDGSVWHFAMQPHPTQVWLHL